MLEALAIIVLAVSTIVIGIIIVIALEPGGK